VPDRYYAIPPSPRAKLEYRGLSLDQLEDLLPNSPAWRQAKRITHAPKPEFAGRPLTSLHQGHVALLCTSGMMNGCFGEGKDRHVAYWESVKVVDRREEEEDGTTIIHERERFSQRLTLLYADGRIALLSEKPSEAPSRKEESDGECTPADGQAVRFGLPVLPEWAEWFSVELRRRGMVEELVGLNCDPIAVKGTKLRLLRILSQGLRRKAIAIPSEVPAVVAPARAVSNLA
jgi:hypothetical protein